MLYFLFFWHTCVPATPVIITSGIKNPRHKTPRHTRRHPRHDESRHAIPVKTCPGKTHVFVQGVKKDTFYQTSDCESMSVASLELTFTIIRQVLLHFMIILLQYVFFNFKVWELYIRGNFPAPIETWLLHSRGSPLSIRDVSPNWTTYLFWSLFTPQAPALCSPMAMVTRIKDQDWICCVRWGKNCCCSGQSTRVEHSFGKMEVLMTLFLPCPVLSIKSSTRSCGEERPGLR